MTDSPKRPFVRRPLPVEPGRPQTRAHLRHVRKVADFGTDWTAESWRATAPEQIRVTPWSPAHRTRNRATVPGDHPPTLITDEDVVAELERIGCDPLLYYDCPSAEAQRVIRNEAPLEPVTTDKRERPHPFLKPRLGCVYLRTAELVDPRLVSLRVDLRRLRAIDLICDPSTLPHRPECWPDGIVGDVGHPGGAYTRFIRGDFRWGQDPSLVEIVDALGYDRGDLALAGLRAGAIAHLGPIPFDAVSWNDASHFRRPYGRLKAR